MLRKPEPARKTGNTGAEELSGRTHLILDGVYPLYRLIEGNSMKSYGAAKTNRNSTNNSIYKQIVSPFGPILGVRASFRCSRLHVFIPGDPAYQSQASFDQVSDEGVHFCHVHL